MANLPETPTFDAGVYQLETTDPVQGGVAGATNDPPSEIIIFSLARPKPLVKEGFSLFIINNFNT